jgi:hypothetical protein
LNLPQPIGLVDAARMEATLVASFRAMRTVAAVAGPLSGKANPNPSATDTFKTSEAPTEAVSAGFLS